MNQAMRNMAPMLSESNRFELIGTITGILWVISGIFPDVTLYFFSMIVTVLISIVLSVLSLTSSSYFYDIHVASFRRLLLGAWAQWAYTGGKNTGPNELILGQLEIPVIEISQWIIVILIIIWFSSKYFEQFQDPNISTTLYPFLLIRGILRGGMIAGFIYALIYSDTIPENIAIPYLLVIYIVEPYLYWFMQQMNPTMSRMEMTVGNARLPSVALRESFLSNTVILLFTMLFGGFNLDGINGNYWTLLRTYYILGSIIFFIYSLDAIKRFKQAPLGKNAIADFLNNTPDVLSNLDLENSFGHVIEKEHLIKTGPKSALNLDPGAIVIPLEKKRGKVNALVLGKGQSILDTGERKVGELVEGVSTVMIPAKEFKSISKDYIGQSLAKIDLNELNLPTMDELNQYVTLLARNMGGFVEKIINQINSIDLSNYGIIEEPGRTQVNLPGIQVNETPDLTSVKVGGLRVLDGKEATTVRWGNTFTVVDLPKANFVSLPGITVMDIAGEGSAVNILGFKISDGLPAERLEEFRNIILAQLDRWEAGIDAQLGRYLADKSATGLLSVGWDGEFNLLLDSNKKTMGNHQALELSTGKQKGMSFLPPNFDEKAEERTAEDIKFIELTGIDPTPGSTKRIQGSKAEKLKLNASSDEMKTLNETENDTNSSNRKNKSETESDGFTIIHDVTIDDDE